MNHEQHKHRLGLTILVSIVIFCTILITAIISSLILLVLVKTGFIGNLDSNVPSSLRMLFFMLGISIIVGLIVSPIVSRIPLLPINNMINQIGRLASGDFKARLHFSGPLSHHPTFRELSEGFNKMASELQNTEMLRSDFINNFSHEFKTPIVSIAGFTKLLKRGNLEESQQLEYLDAIETESMRLSNMATNVLDMTRVENLSILTNIKTFNLSEQMRNCILLFESKWDQKNIGFEIDFDEYQISANEELLKQVWINLIDNAIKFSPEGGMIQFKIYEHDEKLAVVVGNTGPTIPSDVQKRIFNKFYQADESHSTEGNGIGLAIVKRVVDLHGGNVTVRSQANYTTFMVELPKGQ